MTGGGTAGHVNPAIAIANTIKEYDKESEIAFVCSHLTRDKAQDLVPRAGYEKLYRVHIMPSFKIYNPKNVLTLISMIRSEGEAKKLIREFRPDVIIGTGGFACYPVLNAGAKMGIPTLVHESNAIAGKAVLKLASKVDAVMTNFETTKAQIKGAKRVVSVGNPQVIGHNACDDGEIAKGYKYSVVSFGGSMGAETLNRAYADTLCEVAKKHSDTEFYHAAGKRDFEELKKIFAEKGLDKLENVKLVDYIYDMDARMKRADIVISRAGAMTLSELALLGKAAVLVPSPFVAANHQFKNAKTLSDKNACVLVEEKDFASGKLTESLESLLADENMRDELSKNIKTFAKSEANRVIYEEIVRAIDLKKKS